jgi:hypothetical protein
MKVLFIKLYFKLTFRSFIFFFSTKKSQYLKKCPYEFHTLPSNPCQSVRECPKILKICQITKLDMGFQKKNISSRSENIDFFESYRFLRQCLLRSFNLV